MAKILTIKMHITSIFQLLDGQHTYFKALLAALGTDTFVSKKDIEMTLENARQLHGIYMRVCLLYKLCECILGLF